MAQQIETLLSLLAVIAGVSLLARRLAVPSPILLVLAGVVLAFVPGIPAIPMNPDVILLLVLPPLVYSAAFGASWPQFRENLRAISMLAVGLILATSAAVAAAAHWAMGFSWPVGFVLGAVVAPPDEVAAVAVFQRLGVPTRILTVLEGEGLVNDGTALTVYRLAVGAVASGAFSLSGAVGTFAVILVGEISFGLAVGWALVRLRRWADEPLVEITLSLLTPFVAYLPPQHFGGSGVLAVTAAGLYTSWQGPELIPFDTRLPGRYIWDMAVYMLNGLLFLLTGLQLKGVAGRLAAMSWTTLAWYTVIVSAVVIATRFAWVFPSSYGSRMVSRLLGNQVGTPPWRQLILIAFTGLRGGVSLAAALALPFEVRAGQPFPHRDLLIFLTYGVILATLLLPGLCLPWVIRLLKLDEAGAQERAEEERDLWEARTATAEAALEAIRATSEERRFEQDVIGPVRDEYHRRLRHDREHVRGEVSDDHEEDDEQRAMLRRAALAAEREKLIQLRDEGKISDAVLRRVEQELDLEETQQQYAAGKESQAF